MMNWEAIGAIGEVLGAAGVIGTLAYLAFQIRQNSESVRLNAGQTILISLHEALQNAASTPQQARVLMLGQTDFDSLPDDEKAQFLVWIFSWFRVLEQAHLYQKRGILDPEIWTGHVVYLRQVMKSSAIQSWWEIRKIFFSESFQAFVDEAALAESSALNPRDMVESVRT